jgi:hypothetical protein
MSVDKVSTTYGGIRALLRSRKRVISNHFETCGPISHVWLPSTIPDVIAFLDGVSSDHVSQTANSNVLHNHRLFLYHYLRVLRLLAEYEKWILYEPS